jgi:hypothetical protein
LNDPKYVRRSIYGKVSRQTVADVLRLFDFPDAKQHAEERIDTTTPLQQLYLLNSPFVRRYAAVVVEADDDPSQASPERVRMLFHRVLQREPTSAELDAALRLLAEIPREFEARRMVAHSLLAGNEFLYVD